MIVASFRTFAMRMIASITIAIVAMSVLLPGTVLAEDTIAFDRNGNDLFDVRFVPDFDSDQSGMIIQLDNDEDGEFDFGFLSGGNVHDDGEIYAMWIDRNNNGSIQKNEVKMLPGTLPWATFPSSFSATHVTNSNGSIDHFMDYTLDDAFADQRDRDLDADGFIESMTIKSAIGEGSSDALLQLGDTNGDGFFDRLFFRPEIGDEVLVGFTKALQRHLPVMHYPQ